MADMEEKSDKSGKQRVPKRNTKRSLKNVALYYLQRYASSSANLKSVLMRRVHRSCAHHGSSVDVGESLVDGVINRLQELGLLNDAAFAEAQAISMHRRGNSRRAIKMKLFQKGLGGGDIDAALSSLEEEFEDFEFIAAAALARRRRLGPYRDDQVRKELYKKDLATISRAGFSYDIAKKVIDTETIEELEADRIV
jgi:regulatory protein